LAEVRVFQRDGVDHGPARVDVLAVLRVAISIILGERSIAVTVPVVSLSHTRETATPWPQPTSGRRSAGRTSRVSTAQTNRSSRRDLGAKGSGRVCQGLARAGFRRADPSKRLGTYQPRANLQMKPDVASYAGFIVDERNPTSGS
jgi:hypothetical protein